MLGRKLVHPAFVSACLVLLAGACGGLTGVDDTGVVVTPLPITPGAPGPAAPQRPSALRIAGAEQRALVNQTLANPLVVTVVDTAGAPVARVPVTWKLGGSSGRLVVVTDTTGADGRASAVWTLGSLPGPQTVSVAAGGLAASFGAVATLQYESVDAGGFHACAITPSAAVYCWGYNGDGQLGTGDHTNRNVPTPVASNLTLRQLSGGRYHTCGITLSGIAHCWGANLDGRLGNASNEPSPVPVQAATPVAFAAIGSGWNHTCGLSKSGIVYCWGFNQQGEVGAKIPPADSVSVNVPRPVSAQNFTTMAVGGLHSCALDLGAQAWCWGFNGHGQLGDGTTEWTLNNVRDSTGAPIRGVPVPVVMPAAGFSAIATGAQHTCAIASGSGAVWCWGDNRYGQIGANGGTRSLTPVAVPLPAGVSGFASISAGDSHTCAVTAAGKVWCWGDNRHGQLGAGTAAGSSAPLAVSPDLTFRSFSAGETLSCGLTTTGAVHCVGNNLYGQIGDATNEARTSLVKGAYQP